MSDDTYREFARKGAEAIHCVVTQLGPLSKESMHDFIHDIAILPAVEAAMRDEGMRHESEGCNYGSMCPWCEVATLRSQLEEAGQEIIYLLEEIDRLHTLRDCPGCSDCLTDPGPGAKGPEGGWLDAGPACGGTGKIRPSDGDGEGG